VLGCLRNAAAVARFVRDHFPGEDICVVAAGERWPDGSLRPALEDELGAGAIIAALDMPCSAEATIVREVFSSAREHTKPLIWDSMTGRELRAIAFGADVEIATELNVSACVPMLSGGKFIDAAQLRYISPR
jgi:2-phosphosulfolactate phosphatase